MTSRIGFYLDLQGCTGCKACQIACKDKNQLPVGVLWRRVIEVSGGRWLPRGKAWLTNIFTYFVTAACMHCEAAVCLEVCPTGAIYQRNDGIVLIDDQRCIGCGYCEMACPYKALQFDHLNKIMTKCDFCVDLIDTGHSPACVSACQMRVLGDLDQLRTEHGEVNDIFPLPDPSLTQPSIVFTPHQDAVSFQDKGVKIGNQEEI